MESHANSGSWGNLIQFASVVTRYIPILLWRELETEMSVAKDQGEK